MYNNFRVNAIVQARMTSSRLPGKVLLPLAGKPVLQHIIERLRRSKYIDEVVIACTTNEADQPIIDLCNQLDCKYYRGSEDDVLTRVLEAAKAFETDIIVEITSDCPCCDWNIIDTLIESLEDRDYVSNVMARTMPRGLDVQVFWTKILEMVDTEVDNDIDRTHVSSWIYKNPKNYGRYKTNCIMLEAGVDYSNLRLTLDTKEDYHLLRFIYEAMEDNSFALGDILNLFRVYPELPLINQHIPQKSYYRELVDEYEKI